MGKARTTASLVCCALMALLTTGCANLNGLATSHTRDKNTVAPTDRDRDVLLAGLERNQRVLASKLDSNIEKGLVVNNRKKTVERTKAGEAIFTDDGNPLYGEAEVELRLNSFHSLADRVDELDLKVAVGSLAQADTNQVFGVNGFDGLDLRIRGSGGTVLDPGSVKAPYEGRALEAESKAQVLEAYWKGRTGYAATVISTAGERVSGLVREVLKVTTPQGSALAAAEVLLEKTDGSSEVVKTNKPPAAAD